MVPLFIYDFLFDIKHGNFGLEITYRKERTRRNLRRKRKSREFNRTNISKKFRDYSNIKLIYSEYESRVAVIASSIRGESFVGRHPFSLF